jgi:hypothetical protein
MLFANDALERLGFDCIFPSCRGDKNMIPLRNICVLVVFVAAAGLAGCALTSSQKAGIEPSAADALKKMSDTLRNSSTLEFHATTVMDEPVETGQTAQFERDADVVLRRPNNLYIESRRGDQTWDLWYSGKTVTILDKNTNTYATEEVPGRVDEMMDDLATKYDIVLPLADFIFADPYKVLTANAESGAFVGNHKVNGAQCRHLMFVQPDVDWQIWLEDEKNFLPRKIVIDYKNEPGRPEFVANLSDFALSVPVSDDTFKPKLPEGAKKVDMSELLSSR